MGATAINRIIEEAMSKYSELDQAVIDLHNVARTIEQNLGIGKLSIECRRIADRLSEITNPIPELTSTAKGDQ